MCLYPRLIPNGKYRKSKKNGGNVPIPHDRRVLSVPVGCGRCMECVKKKAREWQTRLLEDVRKNKNGKFITLTFSNESIKELNEEIGEKDGYERDNAIATIAIRRFLERWRKENKKSLRHWMVTELGHKGTENIHMHGIVWTDKGEEEIKEKWKYGYVWVGKFVNEQTVNYITKYVHKVDKDHEEYKSKILTSAGIGGAYTERADAKGNIYKGDGQTKETYTSRTGHEMAMPIYWRNKIYSEEERERLWIEKLDNKVRYINGKRIDVSTAKGEEAYWKILKTEQARAKRLGYQDNETDWDKKRYEEERRNMLTEKRIRDASGGSDCPESAESVNRQGLRPSEDW